MVKKQTSRIKPLSLAIQDGHIKSRFEGFTYGRGRDRAEWVWTGKFQPAPDSPRYTVEVRYKIGKIPKVWVRSPNLLKGAPHRYGDGSLCLYTPWEWSWRDNELIAETILPWAAEWLFYYELWVDTEEWHGPETPHNSGGKKEQPGK
jgi:hypothetical protein